MSKRTTEQCGGAVVEQAGLKIPTIWARGNGPICLFKSCHVTAQSVWFFGRHHLPHWAMSGHWLSLAAGLQWADNESTRQSGMRWSSHLAPSQSFLMLPRSKNPRSLSARSHDVLNSFAKNLFIVALWEFIDVINFFPADVFKNASACFCSSCDIDSVIDSAVNLDKASRENPWRIDEPNVLAARSVAPPSLRLASICFIATSITGAESSQLFSIRVSAMVNAS